MPKTPEEFIADATRPAPVPPVAEQVPPDPAKIEKELRKKFLSEEIAKILMENGGLESNIPANDAKTPYWTYQNELRSLK